ncbi:NAD-dependent DNA ligase LigA [Candidatus Falkowbacteria bacterium]|nr:NAD-dependent DNA ligase LigA [Candidatus Falkowbacteria bacterium]
MSQEIKQRIDKLKAEIDHHRYLYHVLDQQEISEAALDSLKHELFRLEQAHPELITPDSPTQRVAGEVLAKFAKVEHSQPMLSLYDAFSPEDMRDWEARMERILPGQKFSYYCELKMDGLAMSLVYRQGVFVQGATRGDGRVGENVTQNLRTIESIPLRLRVPTLAELKKIGLTQASINTLFDKINNGEVEVRGEAIMNLKTFANLNKKYAKEGKPLLANPRNGAAGSIRQLDTSVTAERQLDFHVYALVTELGLTKHEEEHELAKLLGFKILKENKLCKNLDEAIKFHDHWEAHKHEMPFECDGAVILVDDTTLWPKLGVVGKGPRYVMAYKFAAEQVTTKLLDVIWQVGRTGALTPTAVLEPVRVGGVTVSRSTLHNMDEIERLDLRLGDTVILERAGDVIPKIIQALVNLRNGKEKKIAPPKECPMCDSPVVRLEGEVAYRCSNKSCYAANLRGFYHWTSKVAMDIPGLGPKIIDQLVKEGLVADPSDFYALTVGDLLPLERFAEKSAENLIDSINERKAVPLERLLVALGIRHVGEETALLLAKEIAKSKEPDDELSIGGLIEIMDGYSLEELQELPDIGPIVGQSIYEWFHAKHNIELLKKLAKNGLKLNKNNQKSIVSNAAFSGKTLVLTGTLSSLTRDEAKAKIRELGGKISSSVSKKTDFVVAGVEAGSKLEDAKKLDVKILTEEEFLKIANS